MRCQPDERSAGFSGGRPGKTAIDLGPAGVEGRIERDGHHLKTRLQIPACALIRDHFAFDKSTHSLSRYDSR